MSKFYRFYDNSAHPTKVYVVHAHSKEHAAEILGRPLGRIAKHLNLMGSEYAAAYSNITIGNFVVSESTSEHQGLTAADIDKIGSIPLLSAAKTTLLSCKLTSSDSARLNIIISLIDDLENDLKDKLLDEYKGFKLSV